MFARQPPKSRGRGTRTPVTRTTGSRKSSQPGGRRASSLLRFAPKLGLETLHVFLLKFRDCPWPDVHTSCERRGLSHGVGSLEKECAVVLSLQAKTIGVLARPKWQDREFSFACPLG